MTMQHIAGLDLSPTRVAIALITRRVDGSTVANASSFTSRLPAGEERIADLAALADRATCNPVLAVIAPADGSPAGGLRRAVLATLARRGVQVVTVAPGDASSTDVAEAWPMVTPASPGELAALRLARSGAVRQGWVLPTRRVTEEARSDGRA